MGIYTVNIVGESHYQDEIERCEAGELVDLRPEPGNRFDRRAIRVVSQADETIGYLPRDGFLTRLIIDEEKPVFALIEHITGGTPDRPSLGVVLNCATGGDGLEACRERGWSSEEISAKFPGY
ncbi:HIRAN domain-containing protein [Sphingomonas hengshuiensis]|uniref:HIRAN domain-containing protein n=1 Tax=Sphingomonas hengshuiensis TaxID=1609977 RepID=A0A7U4J9W9_9SPHN|nr:HIRAN domain-containing protein [Sphingomonas hengshuiensis]AJP72947.1 hypothetical protein TS85_15830 [Sphingomonas hengshuiensis]